VTSCTKSSSSLLFPEKAFGGFSLSSPLCLVSISSVSGSGSGSFVFGPIGSAMGSSSKFIVSVFLSDSVGVWFVCSFDVLRSRRAEKRCSVGSDNSGTV
jgi:hypothetical protein